jgi:hypothetical protein
MIAHRPYGERGGGYRQHPGGQRAVVLPGGEQGGRARKTISWLSHSATSEGVSRSL